MVVDDKLFARTTRTTSALHEVNCFEFETLILGWSTSSPNIGTHPSGLQGCILCSGLPIFQAIHWLKVSK